MNPILSSFTSTLEPLPSNLINNLLIARLPCGTQRGLLPLLPSGPDGVCNLLLRRTRLSTRSSFGRFRASHAPYVVRGGERGIRTLDPVISGIHDFQSCPFGLSGISPSSSRPIVKSLQSVSTLSYRLSPRERDVLSRFAPSASLRSPNPRSRY